MATRLYFTANAFAGPTYPADANWNDTSQSTTQSSDMVTSPDGDADFAQTAQKNSAANPHSILHIRYRYALPAGITLQGNIRGQHLCQDLGGGSGRAIRAISVRVFDSGTTLRANLVQDFPSAIGESFNGTTTNEFFPPSTTIATPYTTVAGDVLVVELGAKWFTAATGGTVVAGIRCGDQSTTPIDLPVDNSTGVGTPEQNGWLEFESVDFFGGHDDWLMTTSGPLVTRMAAPSKRGVHHFDTDSFIENIYGGAVVGWKRIAIAANGGAPIGTEINFQDTTDVDVTLAGQNFKWNAQALSAETNRANYLRLTDDASFGCMLTAQNGFAQNMITLIPPNRVSTNVFIVGRYGNVQSGAATYDETVQFRMSRTDTLNTSTLFGFNIDARNNDVGAANIAVKGGTLLATAAMSAAGAPSSTVQAIGYDVTAIGGLGTNSNFQGSVFGLRAFAQVTSAAPAGNPVSLLNPFQTGGQVTRCAVSDFIGANFKMPTVVLSGSIANYFGSVQDAMTQGSSRVGHKVIGASGGSPGVACAFLSLGHAVGTTRRGLISDNSNEAGADWINRNTGTGLVTPDPANGSRYWRLKNSGAVAGTTKDATYAINEFGVLIASRASGATGTVSLTMEDTGSNTMPAI